MAAPTTPVYLPGGKGMVRVPQGGGEKRFVIDADECCCDNCYDCASTYYADLSGSGDCNMDRTYAMTANHINSVLCKWFKLVPLCGSGAFFPSCTAMLLGSVGGPWSLAFATQSGACEYEKATGDCPSGLYSRTGYSCSTCPTTVTVYT